MKKGIGRKRWKGDETTKDKARENEEKLRGEREERDREEKVEGVRN